MTDSGDRSSNFPITQWSLVLAAGRSGGEAAELALAELLKRYAPALRQYLAITRRVKPQDIDDLVQGFVLDKMISRWLLQRADQQRGRFRNLVIRSLDNYCITQHRRDTAAKRGAGKVIDLPIDDAEILQTRCAVDSFDVAWARQIVSEAMRRCQADCSSEGREDLWLLLEARLLGPIFENRQPVSYEQLAGRCGFRSPKHAANALTTAKTKFAEALYSVVGEYVRDQRELEQEIMDLHHILSQVQPDHPPR